MNKYTGLSDFEINKAAFHKAKIKYKYFRFLPNGVITYNTKGKYQVFDSCNNPADAMPIIIENDIDLLNGENMMPELFGHHSAYTLHNFNTPIAADSLKEDKTIYRLGMEVFLMKKDAESNQ
ncbi:hypothetical protein M2263_001756 [Providencia alcalifaciens]|nr:hypothetical protein [Providencia alcalifaciens]